jgi:hypothetical protein
MKRLALALAASFLGTGCFVVDDDVDCDFRDVLVEWSGFAGPDAADVDMSCGTAGVQFVDLYLNDVQVPGPLAKGHFACGLYGVTIVGVGPGSHTLTTEGIAADAGNGETIVYRDDRSFVASGCDNLATVVEPAAGLVDLQYQFHASGTPVPQVCAGEFLWLSIRDEIAGAVTVLSDSDFFPETYTCGGAFRLALPAGPHTLEWMEERAAAPSYSLRSADCLDRPFTVQAFGVAPVPVNLDRNAIAPCQ